MSNVLLAAAFVVRRPVWAGPPFQRSPLLETSRGGLLRWGAIGPPLRAERAGPAKEDKRSLARWHPQDEDDRRSLQAVRTSEGESGFFCPESRVEQVVPRSLPLTVRRTNPVFDEMEAGAPARLVREAHTYQAAAAPIRTRTRIAEHERPISMAMRMLVVCPTF
jgi:hypothetical protein